MEVGDRVLIPNLPFCATLTDQWESNVYIVQKRAGDLPVYSVP